MIYGFLSTVVFIIILPFWLVLGVFKPKLTDGFKQKCGFYDKLAKLQVSNQPNILFYGVSVGEVNAMENLIKKTKETFPKLNIILLTGTKTGQDIAQKKFADICTYISYFPYDFPFCIETMLKKLNPKAVFVMETELWPNFSYIMNKKKIPFYIINARISDRTYESYKKLSFIFGPILRKYTGIFPQSKQDMKKFISIGAEPKTTQVMGNLKFDTQKQDIYQLNFNKNPNHKIILAGSTHGGEDEIILKVFSEIKKDVTNLKLMIAPRHPERNDDVFKLIQKTDYPCGKRTDLYDFEKNDILLLNTMGELGKFYSICDIAFIGGSFNKTGGHNPLEATIFNKPVVSGPSVHNFKDIYTILASFDAGKIVRNEKELKEYIYKLLTDEKAYKKASEECEVVFEQNKGALDFVLKVLQTLV